MTHARKALEGYRGSYRFSLSGNTTHDFILRFGLLWEAGDKPCGVSLRLSSNVLQPHQQVHELKAHSRIMDQTLNSLPEAVCTLDATWRIIYLNQRAADLLGYDRQWLQGRDFCTVCPADLDVPWEQYLLQATTTGQPVYFDLARRSLRATIWPSGTGATLSLHPQTDDHMATDSAHLNGSAMQAHGVSHRLQTDDAQSPVVIARMKQDQLAALSHEIRTPLNGILGLIAAMQEEEDSARIREMLDMLQQSAGRLHDTLAAILEHMQPDTGQIVWCARPPRQNCG
ncbi:MAG: hypothetical protein OHK0039_34930 [Bacteroidia bacterium]